MLRQLIGGKIHFSVEWHFCNVQLSNGVNKMLNISSSLRGIGKKTFLFAVFTAPFQRVEKYENFFFWKAFLTFSLSISERSKIEFGDVCTMRENSSFALLYNFCLLSFEPRDFFRWLKERNDAKPSQQGMMILIARARSESQFSGLLWPGRKQLCGSPEASF